MVLADKGIPLQQVLQFRQQGLTDNQIIQTLQGQGFGSQQIFDGMSQADVAALPSDQSPVPDAPPGSFPPQAPQPAPQPAPQEQTYDQGYADYQYQPESEEKVEEIVDALINEKWEELSREFSKITEWKSKLESRLQKVEDGMENLKEDVNQLRQGVLGKINDYDENMRNVSADLKAVQKVFKEIIPEFTKNVAELGRMTKKK